MTRRTAAVLAAAAPMQYPPASSVPHWLALRGFAALAPLFDAHEIDMDVLPQLTGEDLEDMGLADFRTRVELLVHVTQECNARAMAQVSAALDGLTEKQGERLAGVRETTLAVEAEEAEEGERDAPAEDAEPDAELAAEADGGEQDAEADAPCALGGEGYVVVDADAATAPSWPAAEACGAEQGGAAAEPCEGAAALDAAPAGALDTGA